MAEVRVTATNVKPFLSAVSRADAETRASLAREHKQVAQDVVDEAQGRARAQGGVAAKAAPSLRAHGTATAARISLPKPKGFEHGAEFGSVQFKQFKAWKGNSEDAGYWLHPATRDMQPESAQRLGAVRARVIEKALDRL